MATTVIQPDGTAGLDATITPRAATTNFGTDTKVVVGELNDDVNALGDRALIKFDLSSIPSTAEIQSATFSLYATEDHSSNARTFRVYRQKRAWVEAQTTWNIFSTGNNWQTAGGFGANDCEQTDIGSRAFTATETLNSFKDFVLDPAKVQEWVSGAFVNNGMLIRADTESNDGYYFASSDNATAANRPKLTVVYVVVEPVSGSSSGTGTVSGILSARGHLEASVSSQVDAQATGHLKGYLRASEASQSVPEGTLRAAGKLEGSIQAVSTAIATAFSLTALSANLSNSSNVSGTLLGKGYLSGESLGESVVFGNIFSENFISGNSYGTVVVVGAIIAIGYIQGLAEGSSLASLLNGQVSQLERNTFKGMYRGMHKSMA